MARAGLWAPGPYGTTDDYGTLVAFLASDDARWISGGTFPVSGSMR
ncbi:hypothetical protein ABT174_36745 [Streptomyces sparsogenes]